jgi:NSS family neurotransmitter:Na+ symporter
VENNREQWKNQTGFILAAIGSAVGLGNIWRFSYLCYTDGGGAYLIPYLIALFTAGVPLLLLEFGLGHWTKNSAPLAFRKIGKPWEFLGWWTMSFILCGIVLYYSVIIAWCINYWTFSFSLAWGSDPNNFFFHKFLKISSTPTELGLPNPLIIAGLAIIWLINWWICYQNIQKGIELACKVFMPTLVFLIALLVLRGMTLPGATEGLKFYLKPNFSLLMVPRVWIDAFSQVFFSLSLAFGIMITYASYLPKESDISRSAFITALSDAGFSIFAGFAVFSILGYMAQVSNQPFEKVVTQGIGLAFVAYPNAINQLPFLNNLFGIIFFLALLLAGISSSISIIEAFSCSLTDKFGFSRKRAVTISCLLGFIGGIIFTTRGGLFWIDIVDHFISQYGLLTVGLVECIIIGWVLNPKKLRDHINQYSSRRLGPWWDITIRFFTPLILSTIVGVTLYQEIIQPYGNYPRKVTIYIGVGWLMATVLLAIIPSYLSSRRSFVKID